MCSKPGGGTSQYREGLRLRDLFDGDLDLLLFFSLRSLERDLDRRLSLPSLFSPLERDLRRRSENTHIELRLMNVKYTYRQKKIYKQLTFVFAHLFSYFSCFGNDNTPEKSEN